jgi:hypothetical protein
VREDEPTTFFTWKRIVPLGGFALLYLTYGCYASRPSTSANGSLLQSNLVIAIGAVAWCILAGAALLGYRSSKRTREQRRREFEAESLLAMNEAVEHQRATRQPSHCVTQGHDGTDSGCGQSARTPL